MMSLDYLLDGLDVSMGRLAMVVHPGSVAYGQTDETAIHYGVRGAAGLEIEEGDTVSLSARTLVVVPPKRRTRVVVQNGMRQGDDVVVACLNSPNSGNEPLGVRGALRSRRRAVADRIPQGATTGAGRGAARAHGLCP